MSTYCPKCGKILKDEENYCPKCDTHFQIINKKENQITYPTYIPLKINKKNYFSRNKKLITLIIIIMIIISLIGLYIFVINHDTYTIIGTWRTSSNSDFEDLYTFYENNTLRIINDYDSLTIPIPHIFFAPNYKKNTIYAYVDEGGNYTQSIFQYRTWSIEKNKLCIKGENTETLCYDYDLLNNNKKIELTGLTQFTLIKTKEPDKLKQDIFDVKWSDINIVGEYEKENFGQYIKDGDFIYNCKGTIKIYYKPENYLIETFEFE